MRKVLYWLFAPQIYMQGARMYGGYLATFLILRKTELDGLLVMLSALFVGIILACLVVRPIPKVVEHES